MKTSSFLLFVALASAMLTGCGGSANVTITPAGDEMRYAQTSFTVQPGQQVSLTFRNTATSPVMKHNVVILHDDSDETVNRVGQAAMTAGESRAYIPEDAAILAHTPLAAPGETVTVAFTAPATPGTYRYICTFPGHYMMMQGTMTVAN